MNKKLLSSSILASLALVGSSPAALIAHYTLDEASGTTAADSSGNGFDMAWQGPAGTPDWQPAGGIAGGAFNFTGTDNDAFLTTTAISQTIPLTMSVWVNTASTANDTLVYVGDGATNGSYYTTKIQGGTPRVVARNTTERQAAGPAVNDSTWHHIASVYVSDTERFLYVDGVLANTNTIEVTGLTATRFGIGALTRGTGPVDEFTGLLDDVQIYDQVLDATQISFLHANPGATIPEPSVPALVALVAGAGLLRRRRS
ncbi:MAG: LamG-like jellyroll fold domain-containing protein [Verrucomicrobiales bacterium]